jgi:CheY-like chemotaxis protein
MLGDRRLCLDSGMDDYLSKPFTWEQLQSKVVGWIAPPERMIG